MYFVVFFVICLFVYVFLYFCVLYCIFCFVMIVMWFVEVFVRFESGLFYFLFDLMGEVKNVDWNEESCNQYNEKLAFHFAHSALRKMGLKQIISKRAEFANDWFSQWKASCDGFTIIERSSAGEKIN